MYSEGGPYFELVIHLDEAVVNLVWENVNLDSRVNRVKHYPLKARYQCITL